MTSYVIIISRATKAIRRVIADDRGEVDMKHHHVAAGEEVIVVTHDGTRAHTPHDWDAAVRAHTGVDPPRPTIYRNGQLVHGEDALDR